MGSQVADPEMLFGPWFDRAQAAVEVLGGDGGSGREQPEAQLAGAEEHGFLAGVAEFNLKEDDVAPGQVYRLGPVGILRRCAVVVVAVGRSRAGWARSPMETARDRPVCAGRQGAGIIKQG